MKFTMSQDGLPRATVNVPFRVSEEDLEIIAFVADYDEDADTTKFRKATRKEVVAAIKSGYFSDAGNFWREDEVQAYRDLKRSL